MFTRVVPCREKANRGWLGGGIRCRKKGKKEKKEGKNNNKDEEQTKPTTSINKK